jgi:hypothetical protein
MTTPWNADSIRSASKANALHSTRREAMSVWKKLCESSGGLADACIHCNDAANVEALAADAALLKSAVHACITYLNASSESVSVKSKQSSLALLCMLSRNDNARDCIFDSLASLSGALEELLGQKEQARKDFGTQLGPFHTLILTLLLRVQRYQLNATDVMELVRGDVALAVEVVGCVCAQQPLEHPAVAASCRILFQMTTPSAHFTSHVASGEPSEHALSAFSSVLLQLQRMFQVSDGVLKRVAGESSSHPAAFALLITSNLRLTPTFSCTCQHFPTKRNQEDKTVPTQRCRSCRAFHRRHSKRLQPQPRLRRHRVAAAPACGFKASGGHVAAHTAALLRPRSSSQRHPDAACAALPQPPRHLGIQQRGLAVRACFEKWRATAAAAECQRFAAAAPRSCFFFQGHHKHGPPEAAAASPCSRCNCAAPSNFGTHQQT